MDKNSNTNLHRTCRRQDGSLHYVSPHEQTTNLTAQWTT